MGIRFNAIQDGGKMQKESKEVKKARKIAQKWLKKYGFVKYVGSGEEDQLEGIDVALIWTEWENGEGEWVQNEYSPDWNDPYPQGYYVMKKPYSEETGSVWITTTIYEACESCDGDDEDCDACDGDGQFIFEVTEDTQ